MAALGAYCRGIQWWQFGVDGCGQLYLGDCGRLLNGVQCIFECGQGWGWGGGLNNTD